MLTPAISCPQADLKQQGTPYVVFKVDLKDVDRAILDGDSGFVSILTAEKKDTILGATIVGPDAGNMICEVTTAMQAGMGLGAIASVIHPYPTQVSSPSLYLALLRNLQLHSSTFKWPRFRTHPPAAKGHKSCQ